MYALFWHRDGIGVRVGVFGNGGIKLGSRTIDRMGDANGEGELGSGMTGTTLAQNGLVCPPKSGRAAFIAE